MKQYGSLTGSKVRHEAAKRKYMISKETTYQGPVLTVNKYQMWMPGGDMIERDIVVHPESVLVLQVEQNGTMLLIEEYDSGKVTDSTPDGIHKQAEIELREEIGYRPGRLETRKFYVIQ